jgi:hypothetical protein
MLKQKASETNFFKSVKKTKKKAKKNKIQTKSKASAYPMRA